LILKSATFPAGMNLSTSVKHANLLTQSIRIQNTFQHFSKKKRVLVAIDSTFSSHDMSRLGFKNESMIEAEAEEEEEEE
jgi:hypothetical protein